MRHKDIKMKRVLISLILLFSVFLSGCYSNDFKGVDITKSGFGAPDVITLPPRHKLISASFRAANSSPVILYRPFRKDEFPEEYILEHPAGNKHTIIKEVE